MGHERAIDLGDKVCDNHDVRDDFNEGYSCERAEMSSCRTTDPQTHVHPTRGAVHGGKKLSEQRRNKLVDYALFL